MSRLESWEGEPVSVWEQLWEVPEFEAYHTLPSTNDRIRELALAGSPAFTVVTAESQTAGRGRAGKQWQSPPGLGLWISFLLRPRPEGARALTPILVGLGTARAIEALCPELCPEIKWPNDVLLGDRKVGGILCEGVGLDAVVVGVGLNIHQRAQDFSADLREQATSLKAAGCSPTSRTDLAGRLLAEARVLVEPLPHELDEGLRLELQSRDALAGRMVRTDTGQVGRAVGLADDGALLIEGAGGRNAIRGGGVSIL